MRRRGPLALLLAGMIAVGFYATVNPTDRLSGKERIAYTLMDAELTHLRNKRGNLDLILCVGIYFDDRETNPSPELMDALKDAHKTSSGLTLLPQNQCIDEPYGVMSRSHVVETGVRAFKFVAAHHSQGELSGWEIRGSGSSVTYTITVEDGRFVPIRGAEAIS